MKSKMKIKNYVFILLLLFPSISFAGKCSSSFVNLLTEVNWECIFPIRIGGALSVGDDTYTNDDEISSPVCVCKNGLIPKIGLNVSFWEPVRMIDTVSDPYCFNGLGFKIGNSYGRLGGGLQQEGGSGGRAFQQMHYYIFPAWKMLDMFADIPCLEDKGFDVAMMSEILPNWNNEVVSMLVNPEALVFGNPVAQLACIGDSVAANTRTTSNSLFWCMGSWGQSYPLAGSITSTDYVEANAGVAARATYLMGRTGLLLDPAVDSCSAVHTPIWIKSHYKYQLLKPTADSECRIIGEEGLFWTGFKHTGFEGDNFTWMMFRKNKCCLSFYQ